MAGTKLASCGANTMLTQRRPLVLLVIAAALAASPEAYGQTSPFAPGRALAPWSGPLPSPASPPQPPAGPAATASGNPSEVQYSPTPAAYSYAPFPHRPQGDSVDSSGVAAWPHANSPPPPTSADRNWKPITDSDDDRRTYVAATVNPALMTFGKTSARLEVAPLAAHAVFLEASRLSLYVDDVSRTVTGTEFDVGYHLFPQGRGAYGFYIGPRYVFGSGEIAEASWEFKGVGGDLGYQWIIANHLVFNLGAGVARVEGKAQIDENFANSLLDGVPEEQTDSFRSLSSQSDTFWVPMVTLGFGLAI